MQGSTGPVLEWQKGALKILLGLLNLATSLSSLITLEESILDRYLFSPLLQSMSRQHPSPKHMSMDTLQHKLVSLISMAINRIFFLISSVSQ